MPKRPRISDERDGKVLTQDDIPMDEDAPPLGGAVASSVTESTVDKQKRELENCRKEELRLKRENDNITHKLMKEKDRRKLKLSFRNFDVWKNMLSQIVTYDQDISHRESFAQNCLNV